MWFEIGAGYWNGSAGPLEICELEIEDLPLGVIGAEWNLFGSRIKKLV